MSKTTAFLSAADRGKVPTEHSDARRAQVARLDRARILSHLASQRIGSNLEILEEIPSTNTLLMNREPEDAPHGLVLAAEFQSQGKGRQGRRWFAPPRANLLFSVVLRPKTPLSGLATLAGACSVIEELEALGVPARLKWPNDVVARAAHDQALRDGRKLGGILCESKTEADGGTRLVLGIGLNVNLSEADFPREIRTLASSVSILLGRLVDRDPLLAGILNRLDRAWTDLEAHGGETLIRKARFLCDTLGHLTEVQLGEGRIEGIAEDLDSQGRLVLRLESGVKRLLEIGEIRQTRRMD
ncbi:MAG: biotin--[acetyl-CoA-carboxylase] ligase [Candidatus Omnitrophica bacterium]|nr:biotin--[acetyl-CoA-carboxylase] ligase [Candidatus Omnitrophota bacterium]